MRRSAAVVTSSPGFIRNYLRQYDQPDIPVILAENKPLAISLPGIGRDATKGPLTIGWFGMLRCKVSLLALDALTRAAPGRFRVILRGRPALDVVQDFHQIVAANPDMQFLGLYRWPEDLARIYAEVDLAWLIDRYQAGRNSDWLLPNRLYEGCLHGAVPIVLDGTEAAAKAREWGCGIALRSVEPAEILDVLGHARERLGDCRAALARLPQSALRMDAAECAVLTQAICGFEGME
ncbi:hypothetical protein [Paracoccus ravus]|uniref:hypothetical protein n=1 Tax=Paracoccus ravus TaxID=2447760 RepID=UPI00106DED5B|nr:hypothetical protein [Paracoccus ravus]